MLKRYASAVLAMGQCPLQAGIVPKWLNELCRTFCKEASLDLSYTVL